MSSKALTGAGTVVLVVLAGSAAIALAAHPKGSWTYSTPNSPSYRGATVSFQASPNGRKLTNFNAGYNVKCPKSVGGFGGIESFHRDSVRVSRSGTFKVSGNLYFGGGKKVGTQTVTGTFVDGGKQAKGRSVSHFMVGSCHGVTKRYTAVGAKPA